MIQSLNVAVILHHARNELRLLRKIYQGPFTLCSRLRSRLYNRLDESTKRFEYSYNK